MCCLFHKWSAYYPIEYGYSAYNAQICLRCGKFKTSNYNLISIEDALAMRKLFLAPPQPVETKPSEF